MKTNYLCIIFFVSLQHLITMSFFLKAKKLNTGKAAEKDDDEGNNTGEEEGATEGTRKVIPARYVEPGLWRIKDAKWRVSFFRLLAGKERYI